MSAARRHGDDRREPLRRAWSLALAVAFFALTGCIERRVLLVTSPPGVKVYRDGVDLDQLGYTAQAFDPADFDLDATGMSADEWAALEVRIVPIDHYGPTEYLLVKPGYGTQRHEIDPTPPLFEQFPFDVAADVLNPFPIMYTFLYRFTLEPVRQSRSDANARSLELDAAALRFRSDTFDALAETETAPATASGGASAGAPHSP